MIKKGINREIYYYDYLIGTRNHHKLLALQTKPTYQYFFKDEPIGVEELHDLLGVDLVMQIPTAMKANNNHELSEVILILSNHLESIER